jgi:hypothetical protein
MNAAMASFFNLERQKPAPCQLQIEKSSSIYQKSDRITTILYRKALGVKCKGLAMQNKSLIPPYTIRIAECGP